MLQESLTGVRVVRAFGRQKYESDRFDACSKDLHDKTVRLCDVLAIYWSGSDMLGMAQTGMTLVFGAWFAMKGELSIGDVTVFVSYISMLIWPIRQLGRILSDFGKSIGIAQAPLRGAGHGAGAGYARRGGRGAVRGRSNSIMCRSNMIPSIRF